MKLRLRASATALGVIFLAGLTAAPAWAQEDQFPLDLQNRIKDLMGGRFAIHDANDAQHQKDMQQAARASVMRVAEDLKAGRTAVGMVRIVQEANALIPEMPILEPQHNDAQKQQYDRRKEYTQVYGQYVAAVLRQDIFGTKDKPKGFEPLVRINAARILARLGSSGYVRTDDKSVDTVDIALDILQNPKEIDAVKVYALQALKNLLALPNQAMPERSLLGKQPEREKKVILALIEFITRPVTLSADCSIEEVDAWRYLRREAIRALGFVRTPIVREDKGMTIVADPAFWLLRIAAGDPVLNPMPSLYERAEALIGFLQLNPDPQMEMDYASWFLAAAIRDLAAEFSARKVKLPNAPPNPGDTEQAFARDYVPWKTFWFKIDVLFDPWKKGWEGSIANPPQGPLAMVNDLYQQCDASILKLTSKVTTLPPNVEYEQLTTWLQAQLPKVMAKSLFKDDPAAIIQLQKN
jgi:hypothetical protein